MAEDMLKTGRCERVVVISGDKASSPTLLPWLGNGFRALGAASMAPKVPVYLTLSFDGFPDNECLKVVAHSFEFSLIGRGCCLALRLPPQRYAAWRGGQADPATVPSL